MRIVINGDEREVEAGDPTLAALVEQLGIKYPTVR